jgi:hypothetical protein
MELDPSADSWVMPNVRGLAGVLGSGLSMIAAGIAALVLVSVLLAFHGWPTNAATGSVPRLIAATTSTQARVPTLVIGRPATAPTVAARGVRVHRAPVTRGHKAPSNAPLYSDASRPKAQVAPPQPKPGPGPIPCTGVCPPVQLPPPIDQIITQGKDNANSLGQQLNDGVTHTAQTVGGVLNDVTKAVGKTLGH